MSTKVEGTDVEEIPSSLELSDEDFLKQDHTAIFAEEDPAKVDADKEIDDKDKDEDKEIDNKDKDKVIPDDKTEGDSEAQEQTKTPTDKEEVGKPTGDTQKKQVPSIDSAGKESLDTSKKDSPDTKGDTPDTKEFDYESAYKKVTEPFKANGVEMTVKDPEDMIRLMQMGVNYQKKMAEMKPNLKILKMLEKNDLLNEEKLFNLIDISKKDPKAIAKLIKESGLDPLDIDADASKDYKPKNHSISDKEIELDMVLNEIRDTDSFSKTINVLTKEWDTPSKTIISDNPEIISVINTHMGNGVYDKVNTMMQQEKALGNLNGVSDIEAYKQIAEHMHKEGLLHQEGDKPQEASTVSTENETEAQKLAKAELDKKRKAVAPVKQTVPTKDSKEVNFLGLSDEDFMKKHV